MAEMIEMPFKLWTWEGQSKHVLDGGGSKSPCKGVIFSWKGHDHACSTTLCHELCKNGWTDRNPVWVVGSGGSKYACVTWGHIGATWQILL